MMILNEIQKLTNAKIEGELPSLEIKYLFTDSRRTESIEHSLFVALPGIRHDGHDFIESLVKKGIRNFIVSTDVKPSWRAKDVHFLKVKDSLKALQEIAIAHRAKFDIPIIAIAGSNGKTVVKEWLWQMIGHKLKAAKSPKSYNSQIGVPLSVLQLNQEHEIGIFEAGISMPGEMDRLEEILKPSIGIITNIREAHLENFAGKSQLAEEKVKLFKNCKKLIYCSDYRQIDDAIQNLEEMIGVEKITWSYTSEAKYQIESQNQNEGKTILTASVEGSKDNIILPFTDFASIENAIHCWVLLLEMGYSTEQIQSWMSEVKAVAMRLEVRQGITGSLIINDGYNNDLASIHIGLDFLNQQKIGDRTVAILSDIEQSGKGDEEINRTIAELLSNKRVNQFIGIGPEMRRFKEIYPEGSRFFLSTSEFLDRLHEFDWKDATVLVKGARSFQFEKIAERLQIKTHETVLEVNLGAIVHNFNYFKSLLKKDTKVMAMVKASSYGAGNYEIANTLEYYKVDYLGVAYVDEGIELKKRGINTPIMVMNPQASAFDSMIRFGLHPEIYNFRTLSLFVEELKINQYFLNND